MRKIVFSFDDGLSDFKNNAMPIFDKFGFKACVNVITKYSELGEFEEYKYLTIDELNDIKNKGYELACHTDTHQTVVDVNDLLNSKRKMVKYFGNEEYGLILPFSQCVNNETAEFILSNYLYFADYKTNRLKNNIYYYFSKMISLIFKNKKSQFYYCNFSYFYDFRPKIKSFRRLPIKKDVLPGIYINFLKHMPNNTALVFMFHSITNDFESCPWPDGSWTTKNLDCLLNYLHKHRKKYMVVTQRELLHE